MHIDLLKYDVRRYAGACRTRAMRLAAFTCTALYLLVAAVPALRIVVHDHAGDDRAHVHAQGARHSHAPAVEAPEHRAHAAAHAHHADDHQHGDAHHHHDHDQQHGHHHHGHDDHGHRHGEEQPGLEQHEGDVLRAATDDLGAHWHDESPQGLATVALPLLLVSLDCRAADPTSISSIAPRGAIRTTRARGPPLQEAVLDTLGT